MALLQEPVEQMTLAQARDLFLLYCGAAILLGIVAAVIHFLLLPRLVGRVLQWQRPWLQISLGIACALAPQVLAVGGAALMGAYALAATGWQPYIYVLPGKEMPAGWMLWLFFAVQSTTEELLFRGIGLALLAGLFSWLGSTLFKPDSEPAVQPWLRRLWFYSGLLANLVICGAFASVHSRNPAVSPAALWNIALAGFALGQLYWLQGQLWGAAAMHIWWNAGIASLGLPVSGITMRAPLIGRIHGSAPGLITGGNFGPEASVLTTVGLGGVSLWLVWQCWKRVSAADCIAAPLLDAESTAAPPAQS
jgi:membrane protease YdiL (CAAX protease family)